MQGGCPEGHNDHLWKMQARPSYAQNSWLRQGRPSLCKMCVWFLAACWSWRCTKWQVFWRSRPDIVVSRYVKGRSTCWNSWGWICILRMPKRTYCWHYQGLEILLYGRVSSSVNVSWRRHWIMGQSFLAAKVSSSLLTLRATQLL